MRAIPPELQARIDSGAATLCLCWRLTRRDGAVMGFTDHDRDVDLDGLICRAATALEGGGAERLSGFAPDSLRVDGALSAEAIRAEDVARGLYDGARLERFLVDWTRSDLRVLSFVGTLNEITRRGEAFTAELDGLAAPLNRPLGRAFQRRCDAALGDGRCGVDLANPAFTGDAELAGIAEDGWLILSGLGAYAPGWFAQGRLRVMSGTEAGRDQEIRAHRRDWRGDAVALWAEPGALAPGDRLRLVAGCDKRAETCRAKFANFLNFRGCPHLPGDDFILSAPTEGARADGGRR